MGMCAGGVVHRFDLKSIKSIIVRRRRTNGASPFVRRRMVDERCERQITLSVSFSLSLSLIVSQNPSGQRRRIYLNKKMKRSQRIIHT